MLLSEKGEMGFWVGRINLGPGEWRHLPIRDGEVRKDTGGQHKAPGMESEFNWGVLTPGHMLEGSGELLQNMEAQAPPSNILIILCHLG